ncbi:virion structural protein [Shewanella phage FishSpeaker]|nr:virion structural protein [Shewanella phage FishSpeaker]
MQTREKSFGDSKVNFPKLREKLSSVNPIVATTLNNAVRGTTEEAAQKKGTAVTIDQKNIDQRKLENLSNVISNNINAITDLREITPYIDKAELIWNTLLLYPNGAQKQILRYDTEFSKLKNTQLHASLLKAWESYFTLDYKIEVELKDIVNDVLWNTGSYVLLNLSRPNLDYLINGSEITGNESLIDSAKITLKNEFNDNLCAINSGRYIRNPKNEGTKAVTGIESLFATTKASNETEFNIFEGKSGETIHGSTLEEWEKAIDITITDNPSLLYLGRIREIIEKKNSDYYTGVESFSSLIAHVAGRSEPITEKGKKTKGKKPSKENVTQSGKLSLSQMETIQNEFYPERDPVKRDIQFVHNNDELNKSVFGTGLTWHLPSESVIPIHRNGDVKAGIDYIILTDEEGKFLKRTKDYEFYQSGSRGDGTGNSPQGSIYGSQQQGSTNQLISSLKTVQSGKDCDFDMSEFAHLAEDLIIKRFMASIIKGDGDNISITVDEETNKIFLQRMFRKQGIRCLYVPGECITYIAIKYNRLGLGQSLVQNAKMHITRLAAMDLADALANLEAAQPHTLMTINVEREDTNPYRSIAASRAAYFKANPRLHSILASSQLNMPQVVDALMQQSLTIKVNANENPHIAAPEVDLSQQPRENFKTVDKDSREEVLNRIANYFFLPRSWLDVSDDTNNFQIEALTEHQMILNQTLNWQETLTESIGDFMRKHARVNGVLLQQLIQIINENEKLWKNDAKESLPPTMNKETKIEMILVDFLNNVYCTLPAPNNAESTDKMKSALGVVNDLVDAWVSMSGYEKFLESALKELGLEDSDYNKEVIAEMLKGYFLTEAFRRFNLPMPFDDIVGDGKEGGIYGLTTGILAQRTNLSDFLINFVTEAITRDKKILKDKEKLKKLYDSLHGEEMPEEESSGFEDEEKPDGEDGGEIALDEEEDPFAGDDLPEEEPDAETEEEEESETPDEPEEEEEEEEELPPEEDADDKKGA